MSEEKPEIAAQLAIARRIMEDHKEALTALASDEDAPPNGTEEFRRQLEVARERMKKYHGAYRTLSIS
jgi:hypothetical protein